MKKNTWFTLIICMFLIPGEKIAAQAVNTYNYKIGIGLRAGETSGIDFKYNKNNGSSIEGIIGLWSNSVSLTALLEKNANASNIEGLRWYYGIGGHISIETGTIYNNNEMYHYSKDFGLGIDGIVGIEYKIYPIPFSISLDLKPLMEVKTNGEVFLSLDPGLGLRFTF